jgi:four helix bundle protein
MGSFIWGVVYRAARLSVVGCRLSADSVKSNLHAEPATAGHSPFVFAPPVMTMAKKTFEDLRVFQRALDLMADVYEATESFPRREIYGLASQMCRASVSVVSHIAEGQGRLTYGEWRQMLSQARGSLYEVQAQVIASKRLEFINEGAMEHLRKGIRATARELNGLIEWVMKRERETKTKKPRQPTTDNR